MDLRWRFKITWGVNSPGRNRDIFMAVCQPLFELCFGVGFCQAKINITLIILDVMYLDYSKAVKQLYNAVLP